jgi:hypothetical protein
MPLSRELILYIINFMNYIFHKIKKIIYPFLLVLFFLLIPLSVNAVVFDLIAPEPPEGGFMRGQTVQFTINIDTQGENINSTQIGMDYDTQYLEYVSTTSGNAMTTVSTNNLGNGKLLFTGENQSGFSGQGVFAYVSFKIIAQAPGETRLCVLWNPESSPTPPLPTSTPRPPTPGEVKGVFIGGISGFMFLSIFLLFFWLKRLG